MGWLSGWDNRIKLTVDYTKVDSELTWFPVTVFLTDAQGEEVFVELDADGDDDYLKCAFTKADGETELYAEVEKFNLFNSQYPPAHSDTYVKATTKYDINYWPYFATDPTRPLTGNYWQDNEWLSASGVYTNQRFHIDLGSAKVIHRIYYENHHNSGTETDSGVKNFTLWGSNTESGTFDDLVYANDEGWTELTCSQNTFDEHIALNQADPKYITVTNSTAYRYYAFKFADNYLGSGLMAVRRIELQTYDPLAVIHVSKDGWVIADDEDTDFYMYYDADHADNTNYIGDINSTPGAAVWDDDFKLVTHMVDATTSTVKDSTSNSHDGTKTGANNPIQVVGKSGYAQEHTGNNAGNSDITITDHEDFDAQGDFSITAVVWCDTYGDVGATNYLCYVLGKDDGSSNRSWTFGIRGEEDASNTGKQTWWYDIAGNGYIFSTTAIGIAAWVEIGISFNNTSGSYTFYKNGVPDGSASLDVTPNNNGSDVSIGGSSPPGAYVHDWDGKICEIRYSTANRNDAWRKATYNSLWDTLLTYGSEEGPGWTGKICGVTNPAKINGIAVADIAKVNGA